MLLGDILHTSVVTTRLEAKDKYEAIDQLVDLLVRSEQIPESLRRHVVDAVEEREHSLSTGMEHGIALPHGSSDQINEIVAAMGISHEGVPFDTLDGEPARLIILILLPRRNFQGHVRTLAGIAHLLNNGVFRERLMSAASVGEALALIHDEERRDVPLDGPAH
ncbi:MAG: PTS sugar transporter subunit IIA [FCB group bacterium]|jgi:mannitol/fructose-specific phosphotransferase system IIA component (Ntr-type)|nr:PTS sugar transporter subunit IIA [FCB group bacterium]